MYIETRFTAAGLSGPGLVEIIMRHRNRTIVTLLTFTKTICLTLIGSRKKTQDSSLAGQARMGWDLARVSDY
jgi:hypothetical protein